MHCTPWRSEIWNVSLNLQRECPFKMALAKGHGKDFVINMGAIVE